MIDRQKLLQAATWLQELSLLTTARKQARWQLSKCAGEHKQKWQAIVAIIDSRMDMKEQQLAQALGMGRIRIKREV